MSREGGILLIAYFNSWVISVFSGLLQALCHPVWVFFSAD